MQNLIVYQFNTLYEILKELDHNLNFKIVEAKNLNSLNNQNRGFSLADIFDANPDEAGFQLFNFSPNR